MLSARVAPFHWPIRLAGRERAALAAGAASIALLALYAVLPNSGAGSDGVEIASAAPPPPPPPTVIETPQRYAPAAAPLPEGLMLRGIFGGGPRGGSAIMRMQDGGERVVRIGREAAPGFVLKEVGLAHALLSGPGGDVRLELGRPEGSTPATPTAAADRVRGQDPAGMREESLQYRLGLAPQKRDGRIAGFAVRPDVSLPALQRAGLRPGDIIVAVNGQAFESEEKVLELSREIAGSYTAKFEFLRDGKRMKATLEVNQRPK